MAFAGSSPETLFVRTTVVSLAVQALMERLLRRGALDTTDLIVMRDMALELAEDLRAEKGTGPQIGGALLEREVVAWWEVIGTPEQRDAPAPP